MILNTGKKYNSGSRKKGTKQPGSVINTYMLQSDRLVFCITRKIKEESKHVGLRKNWSNWIDRKESESWNSLWSVMVIPVGGLTKITHTFRVEKQ